MNTRDTLLYSIATELQLLRDYINRLPKVKESSIGGQLWTDFLKIFLSRREEKTNYAFPSKTTALLHNLFGDCDTDEIGDPISILDFEKATYAIHKARGTENGILGDIKRICNSVNVEVRGYPQSQCGWIGDVTSPEFAWKILDDTGGKITFDLPADGGEFGDTPSETVDGGSFGIPMTEAGIVEFIFTENATTILALLGITENWEDLDGITEIMVTTEQARSVLFSGLGTLSMFGKTLEQIEDYFSADMYINTKALISVNALIYDPDNSLCYMDLDNMVLIDAENNGGRSSSEIENIIRHDFVPIKYNIKTNIERVPV